MFLKQKYIIYVVLDWYTCSEIHYNNNNNNKFYWKLENN